MTFRVTNWETHNKLNFDHLPITMTLEANNTFESEATRHMWDWKHADWPAFTEQIESIIQLTDSDPMNTTTHEKFLRNTILKSAYNHIGLKKVGDKPRTWLPNDIIRDIETRDNLRNAEQQDAYNEIDQRIKAKIKEHKLEVWKTKVVKDKEAGKMWDTIRKLQNQNVQDKSRALETNEGLRITDRSKANAFKTAYKATSKIPILREDRWIKKHVNTQLRSPTVEVEWSKPFTSRELDIAIKAIPTNKAAGPDKIHAKFIANLGTAGKKCMLALFNKSWERASVPQTWRTADIRPIPKKGKDPSRIDSHRPISLTSCVGKTLERIITNRLTLHLESTNSIIAEQAGFRARHGTEDQAIRLSQWISDNFHSKPMKRTLLTLLDFSKAYDRVWRNGLLYKMLQMALPHTLVRWTQSWLTNRKNSVTINGSSSKSSTFRDGVPQGSVIAPILFLIFINDITQNLPNNIQVSIFADDVACYTSHKSKIEAEKNMQIAINNIKEWADRWKMTLNPQKCTTTLFTTDNREADWRAKIRLGHSILPHDPTPTFLGVKYDRTLSFAAHAANVANKVKQRSNIIRQLSYTDWGHEVTNLRSSYIALCRSCVEYAAAGWAPWMSKSTLSQLEAAQRHAARAITGLIKTSPNDTILIESNLPPIKNRLHQLALIAYEKASRLPPDNPRHQALSGTQDRRIRKTDWREMARADYHSIFPRHSGSSPLPLQHQPWADHAKLNLIKALDNKNADPNINRTLGERCIARETNNCSLTIYTDGSAKEGTSYGGAGMIAFHNNSGTSTSVALPAGIHTSSFQAEMIALRAAFQYSKDNSNNEDNIAIITDSLSSWQRLSSLHQGARPESDIEDDILHLLRTSNDMHLSFTCIWCPSHCGIAGNEAADRLAAEGCNKNQLNTHWTFDTAKAAIRRATRVTTAHRLEHKHVYANEDGTTRFPKHTTTNRQHQVTMSRLRSGHHPDLLSWRHKMQLSDTDTCRACGLEPESATHVLCHCPATANQRSIYENPSDIMFDNERAIKIWDRWKSIVGIE